MAAWVAGKIAAAFAWDFVPSQLIRDRDGAFSQAFKHRLESIGTRDSRPLTLGPVKNLIQTL